MNNWEKEEQAAEAACEVFVEKLKTTEATQETVAEAKALADQVNDAGLGFGAWNDDAQPVVDLACSLLSLALEVGNTDAAKEAVGALVGVFSNPWLER